MSSGSFRSQTWYEVLLKSGKIPIMCFMIVFVSDASIAAVMCFLLVRSRTGFSRYVPRTSELMSSVYLRFLQHRLSDITACMTPTSRESLLMTFTIRLYSCWARTLSQGETPRWLTWFTVNLHIEPSLYALGGIICVSICSLVLSSWRVTIHDSYRFSRGRARLSTWHSSRI
jgi:hypothetical protein